MGVLLQLEGGEEPLHPAPFEPRRREQFGVIVANVSGLVEGEVAVGSGGHEAGGRGGVSLELRSGWVCCLHLWSNGVFEGILWRY